MNNGIARCTNQCVKATNSLFLHFLLSAPKEDKGDDGGTNKCGDTVYGKSTLKSRHSRDEVADQGECSATEHGGGHENTVIGCTEDSTCKMWYGQSNEHNGTTIGSNNGHKDTRRYDDQPPCPSDIKA